MNGSAFPIFFFSRRGGTALTEVGTPNLGRPSSEFRLQAVPVLRAVVSSGLLLLPLLWAGCRTPEVKRPDETGRFQHEVKTRIDAAKLDPVVALTMDQCVELALTNNLDDRVRRLALDMQDEKVKLSLSGALPKVNAGWSENKRSNQALMTMGGGAPVETEDQRMRAVSVQAVLPVLDWGTTYFGWKIAGDRRSQERIMLERSRQLLERDVRTAYARQAAAQRQERLARVAVIGAQELVRVANSLEREGLGSHADTAEVASGLAQVVQSWTLLRRNVEQARLALARQLSLPPGQKFQIDDALPPLPPLPDVKELPAWEDRALAARPELFVQDLERRMAANAVRQALTNFIPHLDLTAGYNWSSFSQAVHPAYFNYGVNVTDSLLNGGQNWWNWKLAKKNVTVQQEQTLLLSLGILYEVDFTLIRLLAAHDAMTSRQTVVRARFESLKLVTSRFREGLESGSEAARSLANLYLARLELDRDQTDCQAAWYELAAAAPAAAGAAKPPPPNPLPAFTPAAAIAPFEQVPELFPGADLREYPEVEKLLKSGGADLNPLAP